MLIGAPAMTTYTGYVYLWFDIKAKLFYVGGHFGKVEDSYICSNKPMKRAYNLRPHTFKFRVLQYTNGNTDNLRQAEQYWLDKIKDSELMLTENIQNNTCRYYNIKKNAYGGSHKGHKKNRKTPAWNKGYTNEERRLRTLGLCCFVPLDKPKVKTVRKIQKKAQNKSIKKQLTRKKNYSIVYLKNCEKCSNLFYSKNKNKRFCSTSCSHSYIASKVKVNGMTKQEVKEKFALQVKGRRIAIRDDGSRYWTYPNKNI